MMNITLSFILAIIVISKTTDGFRPMANNNKLFTRQATIPKHVGSLNMRSTGTPTKQKEKEVILSKFTIEEVLTPPKVDVPSIGRIVLSQLSLLSFASFLFPISGMSWDQLITFSYNKESVVLAGVLSAAMIGAGYIFDNLPNELSKTTKRNTEIVSFRMLGRSTPVGTAALVGLVLALAAGVTEEIFFRGYLLNFLTGFVGVPGAAALSSFIFGLAHFPLLGSTTFIEAALGLAFAAGYVLSGFNLFVPIVAHTLYDFATIFFAWRDARDDFQLRINSDETKSSKGKDTKLTEQVDYISNKMFKLMDVNKDGLLDENEFFYSLKLIGYGSVPFESRKSLTVQELFKALDTNGDGLIDDSEYRQGIQGNVKNWLLAE